VKFSHCRLSFTPAVRLTCGDMGHACGGWEVWEEM
jgi:hypothetical protein